MLESTTSQGVVPASDANTQQEPRSVFLVRLLLTGLLLATAALKIISSAKSDLRPVIAEDKVGLPNSLTSAAVHPTSKSAISD